MKEFTAKNPKQLDLGLRLLYAEQIGFSVKVCENEKRKIEYGIAVDANYNVHHECEEADL